MILKPLSSRSFAKALLKKSPNKFAVLALAKETYVMPIGLEYHYQAITSFWERSLAKGGARKETPNTKRNKKIFGAGDEEAGWRCGGVAAQLLGGRYEMYRQIE